MNQLLRRLETWLAKNRSRYLAGLLPGANQGDIDRLQHDLGIPVPESLRALLFWHNGQGEGFVGKFEQDWLFLSSPRIAAAKNDLDAEASKTGWHADWIPFLDNDAGDFLCLDTSQAKAPLRAFWLGKTQHPVIAPSLDHWLKVFVENLEQGIYSEDPERGTLSRQGR